MFQSWCCNVRSVSLCLLSCCNSYRMVSPLETLPLRDPNGWVIYIWIVLSPEETSCICLCFQKETIQESNNVIVFPFALYITVQQPFKPLWSLWLHVVVMRYCTQQPQITVSYIWPCVTEYYDIVNSITSFAQKRKSSRWPHDCRGA